MVLFKGKQRETDPLLLTVKTISGGRGQGKCSRLNGPTDSGDHPNFGFIDDRLAVVFADLQTAVCSDN